MLSPTPFKRTLFFMLFDIIISLGTLFLAFNLRFNFHIRPIHLEHFFLVFSLLSFFKIIAIYYFKIYNVSWNLFSLWEAKKLLYAHLWAYGFFLLVYNVFSDAFISFPRSVLIIDFVLSLLFLGTLRISKRLFVERGNSEKLPRTLLIGVSALAQTLLKERNDFNVVAIVDNSKMLVNSYLGDIKIAMLDDIEKIIRSHHIESVIIGRSLERALLNTIYTRIHALEIYDIKVVSITQRNMQLKPISVEDLLARKPKDLDLVSIKNFISDKVVMITGAGGSIGSELSRQVKNFGAKQMILLDHSEFNLYQIMEELNGANVVPIMQSVQHKESLEEVFKKYKPEIVIHAAAYKHVPLCESNVYEAIQNNVFGTKNVIDLSIAYGVTELVLISTDKAVRPTNVMGTTKRICELYASAVPSGNTEIVAVRFGNVLGSSGSVIPKFQSQIDKGEPITVTHSDITRYFMLIPEACQLVLQAGSIAKGRELFILDMGEPIKIVDLAKKMIELSGRDDIEIQFTGLRAGEKLYEELLISEDDLKTQYQSILVSHNAPMDYEKLLHQINRFHTEENLLGLLKEIVPEFNHKM
ncbi:MAG: UDP-N-acetylglucosamine 4,6-dehydratase [Sulfurovum sp. FS06-10]|nr:MAG: UDP-N-acetylglucosamine 4,6-dehydratase [Sulfurovum sp. FS06-10]